MASAGGYVYVVHEREFKESGRPVYKVGRSGDIFQRLKSYPNGSHPLLTASVRDQVAAETQLKERCELKMERRLDIGHEYFEGPFQVLHGIFSEVTLAYAEDLEGKDAARRAPAVDVDRLLTKYVNDERTVLVQQRFWKVTDVLDDFNTKHGVSMSLKAFTTRLRSLFKLRVEPMPFGEGELHPAVDFTTLFGATQKQMGDEENLTRFLTGGADETTSRSHRYHVRRVEGAVTVLSRAKEAYRDYMKSKHSRGSRDWPQDETTLKRVGLEVKTVNVCKSCGKLARGGYNACCASYGKDNRTKRVCVLHLDLTVEMIP